MGNAVGDGAGSDVGELDGIAVGDFVVVGIGLPDGAGVGSKESEGLGVGMAVGSNDAVGAADGGGDGLGVGAGDGENVLTAIEVTDALAIESRRPSFPAAYDWMSVVNWPDDCASESSLVTKASTLSGLSSL